jgi:hypothetical protein
MTTEERNKRRKDREEVEGGEENRRLFQRKKSNRMGSGVAEREGVVGERGEGEVEGGGEKKKANRNRRKRKRKWKRKRKNEKKSNFLEDLFRVEFSFFSACKSLQEMLTTGKWDRRKKKSNQETTWIYHKILSI